ncbi:MAG TPA: hypothetical protein VJ698_12365 [Noviherbaspirillum sp.]|uniref:hypothetical protein n=1 Tax=Noviherbaspirillum sp. TaxID=1926288 RepID=UPI002B45FF18|nr:hypothetical protein [Noviherbaspirillum sp.]HJV86258.1 hypothetical protein [Noviherbaspirillum sp.]
MIDPTDAVTRSIPQPVRLDFASESRTYSIALDRDLFDQWSVTRSWAGKHNNLRGSRITHVDSFEAGLAMVHLLARRREKSGYHLRTPFAG